MNTSISYRAAQQIELVKDSIADAIKQIAYTHLALKLGFATTWLLYFIFAMGFYVADLWGLTTWLEQNASEYAAFLLFLGMAILMATTLSMIKHVFYQHRAEFRYGLGIVLVIAALGVFFELFNASSQQQNIAYHNAEKSKTFQSTANTTINLRSLTDHSSRLATLSGELATAQSYLDGCKKTCSHYRAKVSSLQSQIESLQASQSSAQATAEKVSVASINAKTQALQTLKEDYHKPVFKFVRDNLGVTISTAVVLIATLIAAGFEFSHALLSRILGEKLRQLSGLQQQLINLQTQYVEQTGSTYSDSNTEIIEPKREPIGFNIQKAPAPTTAQAFKYEKNQQRPIGFWDTTTTQPKTVCTHPDNRVHTPTHTPSTPNQAHLGTAEQQLSIPIFSTYAEELRKAGVDFPPDPALDKSAPLADIQTVINRTHPSDRVHTPTHTPNKPLVAAPSLYKEWLTAIHTGQCKATVRETRPWVQSKIAGKGSQARRSTPTPVDIDALTQSLFQRAVNDPNSKITLNPDYRPGKAKYLLVETNHA